MNFVKILGKYEGLGRRRCARKTNCCSSWARGRWRGERGPRRDHREWIQGTGKSEKAPETQMRLHKTKTKERKRIYLTEPPDSRFAAAKGSRR